MALTTSPKSPLYWVVNITTLIVVIIWIIPTLGLLISSFRDRDQISVSGWWTSLSTSSQNRIERTVAPSAQIERDGKFFLEGNIFGEKDGVISAFGVNSRAPTAFKPGELASGPKDTFLNVTEDGGYSYMSPVPWKGSRGKRVFVTIEAPPSFTSDNYSKVLFSEGMGKSFINSLTVTIPATIIPILIAAFAAYALAWMEFPGRALIIAAVVGLLVVPLQMSLIPLLRLYNDLSLFLGIPTKTYVGIWLAHTGFGLPLAIYLLRNYIAGLPRGNNGISQG